MYIENKISSTPRSPKSWGFVKFKSNKTTAVMAIRMKKIFVVDSLLIAIIYHHIYQRKRGPSATSMKSCDKPTLILINLIA